jgi:hypothetical protein
MHDRAEDDSGGHSSTSGDLAQDTCAALRAIGDDCRVAGRALLCAGIAATVLLAGSTQAPAAVTIGSDLASEGIQNVDCLAVDGGCTLVNTQLPVNRVSSPIDGVIVRWRTYFDENTPDDRLRVVRVNGSDVTVLRSAPLPDPPLTGGQVNVVTVSPGVPISVGDSIGINTFGLANVSAARAGASYLRAQPLIPDEGTSPAGLTSNFEIPLNADIEPDCDGDLLGDETQDDSVDCDPPDTQVTSGPKTRTKKKKSRFEFTSSEPGSTFACSLDDGPFAPCTSPHEVKVKKGEHKLEVQATDAAGNTDPSPAIRNWKVKKKKKR